MTEKEAWGQAFENGRKKGYEEGLRDAVKHGRWKGAGMGDYYCSLCCATVSGNDYAFCPNCGAKMGEG